MTASGRAGAWFDALVARWLACPRGLRWLAVAAAVGALWWSSSRAPLPGPPNVIGALLHNAMHVVAFAVVGGAVWCAAHAPERGGRQRRATVAAVAFALAYGVVDELHQAHVAGRVASAWDVLSDTCGGLVAVWLLQRRVMSPRGRRVGAACVLALSAASVSLATFL